MRSGKALDELEALGEFLADLLALGVAHRLFELLVQLGEIDFRRAASRPLRRPCRRRKFVAVLLLRFAIFDLGEELRLA